MSFEGSLRVWWRSFSASGGLTGVLDSERVFAMLVSNYGEGR